MGSVTPGKGMGPVRTVRYVRRRSGLEDQVPSLAAQRRRLEQIARSLPGWCVVTSEVRGGTRG